jgi:hypothetical protein
METEDFGSRSLSTLQRQKTSKQLTLGKQIAVEAERACYGSLALNNAPFHQRAVPRPQSNLKKSREQLGGFKDWLDGNSDNSQSGYDCFWAPSTKFCS